EIGGVDVLDDVRTAENQDLGAVFFSPEIIERRVALLNLSAHGAVIDNDAFANCLQKRFHVSKSRPDLSPARNQGSRSSPYCKGDASFLDCSVPGLARIRAELREYEVEWAVASDWIFRFRGGLFPCGVEQILRHAPSRYRNLAISTVEVKDVHD